MVSELQSARSPLSRARAVHQEWTQVTDSLRLVGHELNQIVIDSVNECQVHRTRTTELEARHDDLVAENNAFRINNEELKRLLDLGQPNTRIAIESRDAACRKLRHVERVVRELLEDLTPGNGDNTKEGSLLLLQTKPRDMAEIRELGSSPSPCGKSRRKNDTSSKSSGSEETVRLRSTGNKPSTSDGHSSRTASPGNQQAIPSETKSSGSDPSVDLSVHSTRRSSGGDDDVWRLSSSRSPRSAEVICPVHIEWFQERLNLDEDTIYSLESLGQTDEHCFHIQIVDNMAFVYDPFSMDGPGESLLMDWGTPDANEKVRAYVVKTRPRDRVLHTFTFPVKRGVWYYIGAHAWNMKDVFEVWPTLGDKAKDVVSAKLQRRCNRRYSQEEITEMIQDGRLEQFCIEVSSRSLKTLSRQFAKMSLGYEGGNVE